MERYLSAKEVAGHFSVHVGTVKRWIYTGELHGTKTPGGHWRFSEADLDALVASGATEPAEVTA